MKTLKLRIYPNKKQVETINKSLGCCRFIYNWALEQKKAYYEETKKNLSKFIICKRLTDLKKELPWLCDAPGHSLQHAIFRLDAAYLNFIKGKKKYPKFKSKKKEVKSMTIPDNWKIIGNKIRLPKVGWVKFRDSKDPSNLKIKQIVLIKSCTNKFYSYLIYEESPNNTIYENSEIVGIDLGMIDYVTFSDGRKISHPNILKKNIDSLKLLTSNNGKSLDEKSRLVLARKHEKVKNSRLDFIHKLTTNIAENQGGAVVEDLCIKDMMTQYASMNRKLEDSAFNKFRIVLEYKLKDRNKYFKVIDRYLPSSKSCLCGFINNNLTLSDRTWTCPECKLTHDRDILAANNIKRWGTPSASLSQDITSMSEAV